MVMSNMRGVLNKTQMPFFGRVLCISLPSLYAELELEDGKSDALELLPAFPPTLPQIASVAPSGRVIPFALAATSSIAMASALRPWPMSQRGDSLRYRYDKISTTKAKPEVKSVSSRQPRIK